MHAYVRAAARAVAYPLSARRSIEGRIGVAGCTFALLIVMSQQLFAQDQDQVRNVLMHMFDKPEQRLTVDAVSVEGDIAVAGWAQGEKGGRALLRKDNSAWRLILCSGDALKEARSLKHFGLTDEQAEDMAASIAAAESKLDPQLVQKFSRFDGVMMMAADGGHPPTTGSASHDKTQ